MEETCFQKFPDLATKYRQGHSAEGVIDPAHATNSGSAGPFRMFQWSDSAFASTEVINVKNTLRLIQPTLPPVHLSAKSRYVWIARLPLLSLPKRLD